MDYDRTWVIVKGFTVTNASEEGIFVKTSRSQCHSELRRALKRRGGIEAGY